MQFGCANTLAREGHHFGTGIQLHDDDTLTLTWRSQ